MLQKGGKSDFKSVNFATYASVVRLLAVPVSGDKPATWAKLAKRFLLFLFLLFLLR